jgi:phosphatidylserine decarboxylase
VALLATAAAALLLHPAAALLPLLLLAFFLWFFRDPERVPPADPRALVSPADGKVVRADGRRISIFLNLFDVHVCRSPVAAELESVEHVPGRFLAAYKDEASEHNERASFRLSERGRKLTMTLVAGLVARRIVVWVVPGRHLERGQRVGLIRFGSRVDLDLPEGAVPQVRVGQRVRAGVSVVARTAASDRSGEPDGA